MRLRRKKHGPTNPAAHSTAAAVSILSAGAITGTFGSARIQAKSSIEWWVAPSSP